MSQVERTSEAQAPALDAEDETWLQEQLKLYADLLDYLRDH